MADTQSTVPSKRTRSSHTAIADISDLPVGYKDIYFSTGRTGPITAVTVLKVNLRQAAGSSIAPQTSLTFATYLELR